SISQIDFSYADLGPQTVTLTVTDVNGNEATCEATVTVVDQIAPNVRTQDVTVILNKYGSALVTPSLVDDGSSDKGAIADMWLEGQTEYDCGDVGKHKITLYVEDQSGNVGQGEAEVTVEFYEPDFTNIHGVSHGDTVHLTDCLPWQIENNDLLNY